MTEQEKLPDCPYCGRQPNVYHGAYGSLMGDSIECDRDGCPEPDCEYPWQYTSWENAITRWKDHVTRARATMSAHQ